jgi:alpha-beta hydrolase superfamily lysophospholipase
VPRLLEPGGRLLAERLAFHEGVPGHHLQVALARSADAHPLNRVLWNSAFGEGWAVYASNLAAEMGLYSSETTRFTAAAARMHDGLTFVVQHGLHAHGWTRNQAVDTMLKYSGGGAEEAAQQIDYFIAAPAHALAYPMGAKYIEDLRRDATGRLGSRFTAREFHDVVLESGALPLGVLKDVVDRWIAARQRPDSLTGTWRGYWSRAGDTMPVSMTVRRDSTAGTYAATFDADRLRVSGIPFTEAQLEGCCNVRLVLRGDRTTMEFTGTLRGDSLSGVFREGASEGRFAYSRLASSTRSFEERDITFANDTVTLAGSLLLPPTGDSLAAVVFLQGSGAEGRWASRYLASQLASHGIAALIFDKRGVGGSTGDWRQATLDDLAADGAAAVARLHQEPRIARGRIGLHGHSQGGTLAPLAAARSTGVAFIIGSAAAGLPTDTTELYSILNSVYPRARTADDSASALDYASELVAVAYWGRPRERLDSLAVALRDRPWFFAPPPANASYWSFSRGFAQYRALDWWARFRGPVLLVYGAEDQRVQAAASAERITQALRSAGNANVTVRIFPGADHTFRLAPGPGGWPLTAPGYVDTLLDWLSRR